MWDAGYWWIELGGDYDDIIGQSEEIRDDLLKCVYGVWDHLKNQGDHGVDNYDLEWVGMVPGYRESRRLEGDYLLNENDVRANRIFEDAVAYGGWPMDVHVPGGIRDLKSVGSRIYNFEGCYSIPYRCYYSRNVSNLMMAGRNISATKMAFSSTRVMGTCAVGGQAVGTAAALALKHHCSPRAVGKEHIHELQQMLLKNDCFIPGFANEDEKDLARAATISASSETENGKAQNVINGISRSVDDDTNCWISSSLTTPQTLTLKLQQGQYCKSGAADLRHRSKPRNSAFYDSKCAGKTGKRSAS
ncbi:MAG: FAD-dependent oxidoreductase [Oscillospiraceae bacterium]